MSDFACVVLVDPRGWILLQERDEHPVVDPEKWGYPGGGLEPGEDAEQAAYREVAEETGLILPRGALGGLELIRTGPFWCAAHGAEEQFTLYAAATAATDADIACGEGRQIVFVDPARAVSLDLTASAAATLPNFLASTAYARLAGRRP